MSSLCKLGVQIPDFKGEGCALLPGADLSVYCDVTVKSMNS